MRMIIKFWWAVTAVSSMIGGFIAVASMFSETAPAQAAGVAFGLSCAIIPYCIARASAEFNKR